MNLKAKVAEAALDFVADNMVIGLGTGSTTRYVIDLIGKEVRSGTLQNVIGIPTSEATTRQAEKVGIQLGKLDDYTRLDLAIDGADEVDDNLNLIKGWGGALVREKLVELYADKLIIVVDESKLVSRLGTRGPLPVEVIPFAWRAQAQWLSQTLDCNVTLRQKKKEPYITDNQNYLLDCRFRKGIPDSYWVQDCLANRPGIVGHGLFLDMAAHVLVSNATTVKQLNRPG